MEYVSCRIGKQTMDLPLLKRNKKTVIVEAPGQNITRSRSMGTIFNFFFAKLFSLGREDVTFYRGKQAVKRHIKKHSVKEV